MTHFLRRKDEKTVVDVEATKTDLQCLVDVEGYSYVFMEESSRQTEVMIDFHDLQEMRGEWHEDVEQVESPDEFTERKLRTVGEKYGLAYVTD